MEKLAVHTLSELNGRYPKQAFHCLERDRPLWGDITNLQIASAADAKVSSMSSRIVHRGMWQRVVVRVYH